jgi:hypothetical protein
VSHNVLTKTASKNGYLLLRVIRLYLMVDLYTGMDVHTMDTIQEGRRLLVEFSDLLQVKFDSNLIL